MDQPVAVTSLADFDAVFGGPWTESPLGPAVHDYFRQGGGLAVIVRAHTSREGDTATLSFGDVGDDRLVLRASAPGTWANRLTARLDEDGGLSVSDTATGHRESFPELSLVVVDVRPERLPAAQAATLTPATNDGDPPDVGAYRRALGALRRVDVINLLVLPGAVEPDVVAEGIAFAEVRPAVYLVDPPTGWTTTAEAVAGAGSPGFPRSPNAAVYFPGIREPGPRRPASGAVAGVIARTDATRGVWTSPAGLEAELDGVVELDLALDDRDGGRLNALGVNCLRSFHGTGPVVWGARTTSPEWKYLSVLRTSLYLQESIDRGTRWARFEPNDEALRARIRDDVSAFLDDLRRRGAFAAGTTPHDAFFVKCDADTTTPEDVDRGVVNLVVGFAPLKRAEFVTIQLRQLAGQDGGARAPGPPSTPGAALKPEPVPEQEEGAEEDRPGGDGAEAAVAPGQGE
ncbi:MAG TPA: phage tail sheath C-terminal domain-containing protein [Acidimicrobiales bacterium]|nr:phage tail sheath C-terminal domain-containing protein [Acidimicrobiales bacterium]